MMGYRKSPLFFNGIGIRKMKFLHPFHEILFRNPMPDTGVPAKFFPDGRDHDSVIIMSRINQGFRRKTEKFFMNALIQHPGITLLKIGPPTTSDEQRIPAEKHPFQLETHASGSMSRCGKSLNAESTETQFLSVFQKNRSCCRAGPPSDGGLRFSGFSQFLRS